MTFGTRRLADAIVFFLLGAGSTLAGATPPGLQAAYGFTTPLAVNSGRQTSAIAVTLQSGGTVASIQLVTQGKPGADFTAAAGGTCTVGQTYGASQSCVQPVQFAPLAPGERRGAVLLLDGNGGLLGTQPLYGVGIGGAGVLLPGTMQTVAGNGTWVYRQDGVAALQAPIFLPGGVAVDASGNIFLSDTSNNRVRRVDAVSGLIATVAGTGTPGAGGDGGPGVSAAVNLPSGMVLDGAGDLLFADSGNNAIRRLSRATGLLTTIAGQVGQSGSSGDGGAATAALLNTPEGVALDATGNLYIADSANNEVRRVDAVTGIISRIAGTGASGSGGDGGPGISASMNSPWGIALDRAGNVYIADLGNNKVRMLSAGGLMSTFAGSGSATPNGDGQAAGTANLRGPAAVLVDVAGNVYIADAGHNTIRKVAVDTGLISTIAGTGDSAFTGDGGKATYASMYGPYALALDSLGNVFFSDIFHHRIREVQNSLSKLKFLPIQVGRTSLANLVVVENDGNAAMTFSALSPDRNSAIDPGTTTCATATPLGVVASCTVGAQFSPQVTGADVMAEIDLNSDASNTPGVLLLDGEVDALDPTTISLTSSANPAALGSAVTFTALVAGGSSPGGNVRFYDGNTLLGTVSVSGLTASLVTSSLALGSHPITANYTGDAANAPSTSAVLNEVIKQTPVLSLTSSVNPSKVGNRVLFTATVTGPNVAPAGSVVFSEGGSALGNGTINSGTATFATSTLIAGTHPIVASFAGDTNTLSGASAPLAQVVDRWTTTTSLTSDTATPTVGDPLTLVVHVTTSSGSTPTGPVQITEGAVLLTTLTLDAQGNASYTTSALAVGSHDLIARLQADATNDASASPGLHETVSKIATMTTFTSSANPVSAGAVLHLTAQVTAAAANSTAGPLSGTVTFTEGAVTLGSAALSPGGTATIDVSNLPVGSHALVASYGGDPNRAASASSTLNQAVANAATTVQLVSSSNPSLAGRGITLTALVSGDGGVPSGTVTFLDGASTLGSAAINAAGQATLNVSTLSAGTHSLTAAYGGDAKDAASTSSPYSQVVQQTTTAISLTSSVNPSFAGAPVTFTASLTSNGGVPAGQLVLSDGGTVVSSAAMSPTGAASFTLSNLPAGTHTMVAAYAGDTDHGAGSSAPLTQQVQMGTSATSLAVSANPSIVGTQTTFTIIVTGTANRPTGSVTLTDGSSPLASLTLSAAGTASFATSAQGIGDHPISAVYAGDTTHSGSTATLLTIRVQQATATTLQSSSNPSVVGDSVSLTATVTGANGIATTGSVSFSDGGAPLGTAKIANGAAVFTTTSLTAGTHLIVASYTGDATSQASSSAAVAQAVNTAGTTVTLSSSANPSVTGTPVTFSAAVVSTGKVPTGAVSFLEGAAVLGTGTVANGVASFTTSALAAGQHAIVARYGGDAGTQVSTSAALIQVAQQKTTLSLASNVNPAQTVQPLALTAVLGNGARATGVVTFTDGGVILGSVALDANGSTATLALPSLSAGSHTLAASYGGDSQNLPSAAPALTETVQLRASTTSVTASSDTYLSGQQITLVAVVDTNGPVAPGGAVTFMSGGASLGTAQVSAAGAATLTIYPLASSYTIVATYGGDAVYSASTSAGYTINAGPVTTFSMTPSWTKNSLSTGAHTVVDLTFVSVKGFNDTLALGCLELPVDATCTFSTDRMALAPNGTQVVHLTIDTGNPLGAGSLTSGLRPRGWMGGLAVAAMLPGFGLLGLLAGHRGRRLPRLLAVLLVGAMAAGLNGCANKLVQASTPPGTYTVRIQASGTQSGASQIADLTVVVTP